MKIDQHEVHFYDDDYAKRATIKEDSHTSHPLNQYESNEDI